MIQEQFKKGKNPTGLLALQQIADFMTTNVPNVYPAAPQGGMAALNMSELQLLLWEWVGTATAATFRNSSFPEFSQRISKLVK